MGAEVAGHPDAASGQKRGAPGAADGGGEEEDLTPRILLCWQRLAKIRRLALPGTEDGYAADRIEERINEFMRGYLSDPRRKRRSESFGPLAEHLPLAERMISTGTTPKGSMPSRPGAPAPATPPAPEEPAPAPAPATPPAQPALDDGDAGPPAPRGDVVAQASDTAQSSCKAAASALPTEAVEMAYRIEGFHNPSMNGRYVRDSSKVVSNHPTFWAADGSHFMFFQCKRLLWQISPRWENEVDLYENARDGGSKGTAMQVGNGAMEHVWKEWQDGEWTTVELRIKDVTGQDEPESG